MPTLESVKFDHLFSLFKGEPGTRKSTQALSYPKPQYWFSQDRKMNSLIQPAKLWGINFTDIEYDDYDSFDNMRIRLEKFQLNCKAKTIVIDSITSTGDTINYGTIKSKKNSKSKDGSELGHKVGGISVNTMEDYKAEASAFTEMISILKDVSNYHKVNVILIAHVIGARKVDEKTSSTHFSRIIVTGGQIISAKIPAYCSEVYHFNIEPNMNADKEGNYGMFTVHTGSDFARSSLVLPPHLIFNDEPIYSKFIEPAMKKTMEISPIKSF